MIHVHITTSKERNITIPTFLDDTYLELFRIRVLQFIAQFLENMKFKKFLDEKEVKK